MRNAGTAGAPSGDPIGHVIVLALVNRSFDHMLGACQTVRPEINAARYTRAAQVPPRS